MAKVGAPKGNRNSAGKRNRSGGIPARLLTQGIYKATKRIDRLRKDDPGYGLAGCKHRGRGLKVLDRICENIVLGAEAGDKDMLNVVIDRLEGRAKQVTESTGQIEHKHSGFRLTFVSPKDVTPETDLNSPLKLVSGETLEHENS